ncbi:translation initiation factor IF-2-like [Mustela putorius furo]|uniref:Translation initiation factor IF-2-like n=1 Tax=Mustela putorius furo TaxID=9669 RepID=A0A8U0SFJ7_MUSPF|nr:translation initiation factor IF-2-like [Mustela putorius furo]
MWPTTGQQKQGAGGPPVPRDSCPARLLSAVLWDRGNLLFDDPQAPGPQPWSQECHNKVLAHQQLDLAEMDHPLKGVHIEIPKWQVCRASQGSKSLWVRLFLAGDTAASLPTRGRGARALQREPPPRLPAPLLPTPREAGRAALAQAPAARQPEGSPPPRGGRGGCRLFGSSTPAPPGPRTRQESWVCASSLSESSHCRPSPSLVPPEATPHSQNRSKGGATLVVAGSGRAGTETATAAGAARWRWNGGVNACVLKHQTVSRLLLDSRENASPEHALGVRFGPSALPGSLEAPRGPHPAFWDVCQGGSRDPDGSLPAPLARSTLARRLLFFFLLGRSAKGLRKLPAPGPSGARSGGPRHAPGRARTAPPAPSPGPLRPRRDPSELAAPRAAPSGGGVERSSSPSRTPEPHAERAVSPPEVLNFTLGGFSGGPRLGWLSGTGDTRS